MARYEESREDLLREATALTERVELELPNNPESTIAGFRRDGSLSIFFGSAVVYQFNSAGELRRAFLNDRLYKAECGILIQLTRRRAADQVELIRHELSSAELAAFTQEASDRLQALQFALANAHFRLIGQVPTTGDVVNRVKNSLASLFRPVTIARSPRVG